MASSVTARWHGDNYQSRIFWENALNLLRSSSGVVEVTFEADGPRAFDDVIVRYDPPIARFGAQRVSADYHQIKWHVETGGRFGYADLIDPAFIGAERYSILERLKDARSAAPPTAAFTFMTTYRIVDGDPLGELVYGGDKSLLVEKLFDGTTDRSRMGQVRKLWREHLQLATDDELKAVVTGLRIFEGHLSLDELRQNVEWRAQAVGLRIEAQGSDFRLDELARQMKARKINILDRAALVKLCADEGLVLVTTPAPNAPTPIAVRSFLGLSADVVAATPQNTLLLTDQFRRRYLKEEFDWERDIRPSIEAFLRDVVKRSLRLELILDAHASIALLAGSVLDFKSGAAVDLFQKGRVGGRTWRANDGSDANAPTFAVADEKLSGAPAIAVGIGVSQSVDAQMRAYVSAHLPEVGRILSFALPSGPGQQNVRGGAHAAALAEQVSNVIRAAKASDPNAMVHLFAACPNSLLFFLGQQHQGYAPAVVYEFDFDREGNRSYLPAFVLGG